MICRVWNLTQRLFNSWGTVRLPCGHVKCELCTSATGTRKSNNEAKIIKWFDRAYINPDSYRHVRSLRRQGRTTEQIDPPEETQPAKDLRVHVIRASHKSTVCPLSRPLRLTEHIDECELT
jgi:hypothetical protein